MRTRLAITLLAATPLLVALAPGQPGPPPETVTRDGAALPRHAAVLQRPDDDRDPAPLGWVVFGAAALAAPVLVPLGWRLGRRRARVGRDLRRTPT